MARPKIYAQLKLTRSEILLLVRSLRALDILIIKTATDEQWRDSELAMYRTDIMMLLNKLADASVGTT